MALEPASQEDSGFDKAAALRQIKENLARSYVHVKKQEGIIRDLKRQGHAESAAKAEEILQTMHGHVKSEEEIVERMEAERDSGR